MSAGRAMSILLVPILLILLGSFIPFFFAPRLRLYPISGLIEIKMWQCCWAWFTRLLLAGKYLQAAISDIMTEAAGPNWTCAVDNRCGRCVWQVLQATGIADQVAGMLAGFSIPILVLCFLISQNLRCAQGSTTVALMTTAA